MSSAVDTITIPYEFNNPLIETLETFDSLIGNDPDLVAWVTPKTALLTVDAGGSYNGLVRQAVNRKIGSTSVFSETASAAKPSLDNTGGIKGGPVMRFFQSGADKLTLSAALPVDPATGRLTAFTKFVLFKPNLAVTDVRYLAYSGGAGNRHMLTLQTLVGETGIFCCNRVGASGGTTEITLPAIVTNDWHLAIATWNPVLDPLLAGGTAGLKLDNGDFAYQTKTLTIVDATALIIGGGKLENELVQDEMYFKADLSLPDDATKLKLDNVLRYYATIYGVDVA